MFKKIIGSTLVTVFVLGLVGSISGCNTIKGVGEDIERGGERLEKATDKK